MRLQVLFTSSPAIYTLSPALEMHLMKPLLLQIANCQSRNGVVDQLINRVYPQQSEEGRWMVVVEEEVEEAAFVNETHAGLNQSLLRLCFICRAVIIIISCCCGCQAHPH